MYIFWNGKSLIVSLHIVDVNDMKGYSLELVNASEACIQCI